MGFKQDWMERQIENLGKTLVGFILGKKGSGETKRLIEKVNEAIETSNGNVVCIEKQPLLLFLAVQTIAFLSVKNKLSGSCGTRVARWWQGC